MKQKKDYTIIALLIPFFIAVAASCPSCYKDAGIKIDKPIECRYEGRECPNFENCKGHAVDLSIEYFKQGDILYPDYAVPDTLIVIDAAGLNKAIAPIEQGFEDATDGNIAAVMYKYCIIK